jgi:amino acid adenylation domain-containing protein/non-ribosomal peptide synthase protein (TIGR01720 family)
MSNVTTQGYRISPGQTRLWLQQQRSPVYRAQAAIRIDGPVQIAALKSAIERVVDRLEILRTTFQLQTGIRVPWQVITESNGVSWQQLDWTGRGSSEVETGLDELLGEQRLHAVDLVSGPSLQLILATVAAHQHYLILSLPALCADAQSLTNLFDEVVNAYSVAEATDAAAEPLQYADFADWHWQLLEEDAQSPARTYWRDQRLNAALLTHLRGTREQQGRFEVAITTVPVDQRTTVAARSLADARGIPVSDFYLACWQALVWRLSGQPDVVTGAVADERGHDMLRDACGLISTTLPVRTHFDQQVRFNEILEAVSRSRRTASDRQYDFSWEQDVEKGKPDGEPGFFPLAFEFHILPPARAGGPVSFSIVRSFACTDRFHLKINCLQRGDAIGIEWHFDRGVLSSGRIEHLARHYQALVRSAIDNPRASVLDLDLIDETLRQEIVVGFNGVSDDTPIDRCVHECFEDVVGRDPDRTALVYEDQLLSYRELNARGNQLARYLRTRGAGPDVPVALCVERSLDMIVGMLGILKAGGAYVPLDPSLPAERLTLLLAESRAPVVVCQPHLASHLSSSAKLVVLDTATRQAISSESTANCTSGVTPASLAYVIFTSGSTGTPKGVLVEHSQLVNYVRGVLERLQLPRDISFATVSSYAADLGNTAIFPTLMTGGCLQVVSQDRLLDPADMAEYGERHRIDCVKIVPSHLQALLSAPQPARLLPRHTLVLGGEASTWDLVSRLESLSSDCRIVNHYGPTETTVGVLAYRHERGNIRRDESDTVPLGRPLRNSRVYLLDSRMRPVPVGVNGELHIAGAGLARGYMDRPDQTADRFVPDPLVPTAGARMYRTGDLARYLEDGSVEFVGRADHQVKIRGFRVELGEIESALERHESVDDVVVTVSEGRSGDKRLVAYAVRRPDARLTTDELREWIRGQLPDYMVPGTIVWLDALPLNRNGKVDRGALPAVELVTDQGRAAAVPPRTSNERALIAIWSDVLGKRNLGVHDDFFECGGHSLLAMQLITRVREAFAVDLPLPALFDRPTIAGLAESIESLIGAGQTGVAAGIIPVSRDRNLPLSFAQQRLWFLDQLDPGSTAYNRPFALRLTGPLSAESLGQSLEEIVRRHEVLRTTYPTVDGEARQVVRPDAALSIGVIDLRDLRVEERDGVVRRLAVEEARRPFDLAHGPLVRACVLQLSDGDHVLLLSQHHINTDAWSNDVLVQEVSISYTAFSNGRPLPSAELPIQYADFAVWQREWLESEAARKQLAFWTDEFTIVPPALQLPTDRPRPPAQTFRGAARHFTFSRRLSAAVKELSQKEGATLFMTLLAAFHTLLHRYTGQPDVLVGTPIAGRTRHEVERLIGFFVNTLVLRADMRGTPTFSDVLKQVRDRAVAAYANQDLPFEKLVDALELDRDLSRTPLFQVMFVLQTDALESMGLPGLRIRQVETPIETAKFDLTLYMSETEQGLNGSLEYNTDLFDVWTIDRMWSHFETLLEAIVTDPRRRISDLPVLSETERRQLLVEWNDTSVDWPADECVPELIEAQVRLCPDGVAVVLGDQHLTYGELNQKANQVARHLRALGVGPEARVALCLHRSIELVVGVLGVLKAGAAYVPMDPAYPASRLAFILQDSGASVVLSDAQVAAALPAHTARVVCLDATLAAVESGEDLGRQGASGNLSHVIYTSGSTGRPKGVAIEQRSVVTLVRWSLATYSVEELAGVLAATSICFDLSVWELLVPLSAGGTVILAPTALDLPRVRGAQRVTLINTVPSAIAELLRTGGIPASVRTVNLAGEPLTSELADALYATGTIVTVCDLYGPSEDTTYSTFARRRIGDRATIGRPLANTRVYLGEPGHAPLPIGVAGELQLSGGGLARGYLDRPALTAERFLPDALGAEPGQRVYRTGDLARWRADGRLDFLGRLDHQVKIRGFRIELGEIEAALRELATVRAAIVLAREDQPGAKRLVAYLTADGRRPTVAELREHLQERLPAYMIPSAFVTLDVMPLLPNGKVDRRALPAPDQTRPDLEDAFVAARTPVERRLSEIWCRVLRLERVGVHDNFFQLGGDSILSIQIVSQANHAGLGLTPKDVFQHQTIAELAAVAGAAPMIAAEQGLLTGPVPLTAIQHWFFEQEFADPHHFNQAVLLQTPTALDPVWLEAALKALVEHHDVLRHSFRQEGSAWHQTGGAVPPTISVTAFDLSARPEPDQALEMERLVGGLHQSLDLAQEPLLRAAQFKLSSDGPVRLLLVIHHLVVDGVSWRILLEDLQTAYEQLSCGQAIQLPAKTTSFARFSTCCAELANSPRLQQELAYWSTRPATPVGRLPVDDPQGDNTIGSSRIVTVSLNPEETAALLREVPAVYKTQMNDVLLTALAEGFARWTGSSSLVVDLEGHGREGLFTDVDLSRTVGWFTTLFPVRLELSTTDDQSAALKSVKEQLRAIPNRGVGYGLLRYLSSVSEQVERLRGQPQAEVLFNYLGQVDSVLPEGSTFQWVRESSGPTQSRRAKRSHLINVRGMINNDSLQVSFQYSQNVFRSETMEQLAGWFLAALRSVISHCQSPEAGGYTPSDFELANLTQLEIDRHFGSDRTVEDVYALSPLQEGILFHCLRAPNSGAYVSHLVLKLDGPVDVLAFQGAWDSVIARETVLRTGFLWDQVGEPVQIVRTDAKVTWSEADWREAGADAQRASLRAFLQKDRIQGFDLSQAPMIRLALFRIADNAYYFVWTHHHLVIDGWSVPLVLQEVLEFYKASIRGTAAALPPARQFRDYIAWLRRQDLVKAESYWRKTLAGVEAPTSMGVSRRCAERTGEIGNAEYPSRLDPSATRSLREFARQHDLTVNAVVQGAWALLLAAYSGEDQVIYGVALSGRPPSLTEVVRIPGMFINTLPMRVVIDSDLSVREWLGWLQKQQVELREYEYSPLAQVQAWSQVPRSMPLFDTIVGFQNFPVDKTHIDEATRYGLGIEVILSQEQSTSPLTLFVALEDELNVRLVYDRNQFDDGTIARMSDRYLRILKTISSSLDAVLTDLRFDDESQVPELPTMAILPPSAEELRLLGVSVDNVERVASEGND